MIQGRAAEVARARSACCLSPGPASPVRWDQSFRSRQPAGESHLLLKPSLVTPTEAGPEIGMEWQPSRYSGSLNGRSSHGRTSGREGLRRCLTVLGGCSGIAPQALILDALSSKQPFAVSMDNSLAVGFSEERPMRSAAHGHGWKSRVLIFMIASWSAGGSRVVKHRFAVGHIASPRWEPTGPARLWSPGSGSAPASHQVSLFVWGTCLESPQPPS